jgi:hypothetical protein
VLIDTMSVLMIGAVAAGVVMMLVALMVRKNATTSWIVGSVGAVLVCGGVLGLWLVPGRGGGGGGGGSGGGGAVPYHMMPEYDRDKKQLDAAVASAAEAQRALHEQTEQWKALQADHATLRGQHENVRQEAGKMRTVNQDLTLRLVAAQRHAAAAAEAQSRIANNLSNVAADRDAAKTEQMRLQEHLAQSESAAAARYERLKQQLDASNAKRGAVHRQNNAATADLRRNAEQERAVNIALAEDLSEATEKQKAMQSQLDATAAERDQAHKQIQAAAAEQQRIKAALNNVTHRLRTAEAERANTLRAYKTAAQRIRKSNATEAVKSHRLETAKATHKRDLVLRKTAVNRLKSQAKALAATRRQLAAAESRLRRAQTESESSSLPKSSTPSVLADETVANRTKLFKSTAQNTRATDGPAHVRRSGPDDGSLLVNVTCNPTPLMRKYWNEINLSYETVEKYGLIKTWNTQRRCLFQRVMAELLNSKKREYIQGDELEPYLLENHSFEGHESYAMAAILRDGAFLEHLNSVTDKEDRTEEEARTEEKRKELEFKIYHDPADDPF